MTLNRTDLLDLRRRDGLPVTLTLTNGRDLTGRIEQIDPGWIQLRAFAGTARTLVPTHAIVTVSWDSQR